MSLVRWVAKEAGPVLVATFGVLLLWVLLTASGIVPPSVLPTPAAVWDALWSGIADGTIPTAAAKTLIRLTFAFGVSIVLGTALGLGLAASNFARRGVGKLVVALQVIPPPAWVPLAVVWFGPTERAVVFVAIAGAFPSVTRGTLSALRQVPPLFERAGRTLGAKGWRLYKDVVFPAALPGYVSGLQQAWGFAWWALMAGELIIRAVQASGLGQLLARSSEPVDTALLLAVLAVIALIGVVVDFLVFCWIDRRIRKQRGLPVVA